MFWFQTLNEKFTGVIEWGGEHSPEWGADGLGGAGSEGRDGTV